MAPSLPVYVRLMSGSSLKAVNLVGGTSDPYAKLTIARTKQSHTTNYCLNTINPQWYETVIFNDVKPCDVLSVKLFDRNAFSEDVPIGSTHVSVGEALSHSAAVASEAAYQDNASHKRHSNPCHASKSSPQHIYDGAKSPAVPIGASLQRMMATTYHVAPVGTISLIVAPGYLQNLDFSVPRKPYKRFQIHKIGEHVGKLGQESFAVKMVKKTLHRIKPLDEALHALQPIQPVFQEHSTWKITMLGVDEVFKGKRHSWNKAYVKAQDIFQGRSSIVARSMVQMQHAYLYGGASGFKPLQTVRKEWGELTGNLLDSEDFLKVMEYGVRRGKPRMFTYVLMENRLFMAETGAKFFRDMMSKHAMHSSASTEVVYAGELHFRHVEDGSNERDFRLVIDNNSGTYAPGKEDLPKVKEVFERNFPGLHVIALDFKDPLLKQYTEELPPKHSAEEVFGT